MSFRIALFRVMSIVLSIAALLRGATELVPDAPPKAALISISSPDTTNTVSIMGAPGAVTNSAYVAGVALDTGFFSQAQAAPDGSFKMTLFASQGSSIFIAADPASGALQQILNDSNTSALYKSTQLEPFPATIVRVPDPKPLASGVPFSASGLIFIGGPPVWTFQGSLSSQQLEPGGALEVKGTIQLSSPALQNAGLMQASLFLDLHRITNADGSPVTPGSPFMSTSLTPTGFPIERAFRGPQNVGTVTFGSVSGNQAIAQVDITIAIPADLQAGIFSPYLVLNFQGVPNEQPESRPRLEMNDTLNQLANATRLPLVRVGSPSPPRLVWTLLNENLSNGTKGVSASEDKAVFGLTPRILTQSNTFIVPRTDPDTGAPVSYRIEPFAPTVSVGSEQPPAIPLIPFRFPSGQYSVQIMNPDGSTLKIGPAPFVQSRFKTYVPQGAYENSLDPNGPHLAHIYQLSTMNPDFSITFPADGKYVITVTGTIDDIWGNTWLSKGTYEVYVARLLSLDTAVLPMTPFETGDVFNPGVTISPPVPASINVAFTQVPNSEMAKANQTTVSGNANRFGYFHPSGSGIALSSQGEYRVDITASYWDAQGRLWMGARTWGGVVAPKTAALVVHGQRGMDGGPFGADQGGQWFFRTDTGNPLPPSSDPNSPPPIVGTHINFPFNSGDVMWMEKEDVAKPVVTFQDVSGAITTLLANRPFDFFSQISSTFTSRATIGETPLYSSRPDKQPIELDPSKIDLWGYSYRTVQKPLVRIREEIGEDSLLVPYWRFHEQYLGQLGQGVIGDLANDIKFQYGAAVIRGTPLSQPAYGIYGSLFVMVPTPDEGGGSRVFPPFQGNGGGPTGGPLMTLKGRAIDLFVHLTGVRPGSVLEIGDVVGFSGAAGPTLPVQITYTVTGPDAKQTTYSGRANKIGYYYRPQDDFTIQQAGLYTVDVKVTFDGQTSAGLVAQPLPTGDILGSDSGRFYFYAVSRDSQPIPTDVPEASSLSPNSALSITASAKAGHVTSMMPGFVLKSEAVASSNGQLTVQYDPVALSRDFPNLDADQSGGDVVTLTMFDPESVAARVIALHGLKIYNPPQVPIPVINSVANAEGGSPVIAPNTWISIYGSNLAPEARTWQASDFLNNLLPVSLDGVGVTINGTNAYVYYISPTQINVLTPPDLNVGSANLSVTVNGATSAPFQVQSSALSPSFFAYGGAYVLAQHLDGSLIGPSSLYPGVTTPAHEGETVVAYANGLGPVSVPVVGGSLLQSGTINPLPLVTVGGIPASVLFAGLISPGLYQINFVVPSGIKPGENSVTMTLGSTTSPTGTVLTIQ